PAAPCQYARIRMARPTCRQNARRRGGSVGPARSSGDYDAIDEPGPPICRSRRHRDRISRPARHGRGVAGPDERRCSPRGRRRRQRGCHRYETSRLFCSVTVAPLPAFWKRERDGRASPHGSRLLTGKVDGLALELSSNKPPELYEIRRLIRVAATFIVAWVYVSRET